MKITKKMVYDELNRIFGAHSVTMRKLAYGDLYNESKEPVGSASSTVFTDEWIVTVRLREPSVWIYARENSRNKARREIYEYLRLIKPNLPESAG